MSTIPISLSTATRQRDETRAVGPSRFRFNEHNKEINTGTGTDDILVVVYFTQNVELRDIMSIMLHSSQTVKILCTNHADTIKSSNNYDNFFLFFGFL